MKHFKRALITGAYGGLGETLAHLLASKNIPLILAGRDENKLKEVSASLQNQVPVILCAADLAKQNERKKVIDLIHEHAPDLVINNAGFGLYGDVLDYSTSEQMEILEVNANAVLELTIEAARALTEAKKRGIILNISSGAAFFPFPAFSVYAASKAFVTQFSQAFDVEMSPSGIRILAACPGQIDTKFRSQASKGKSPTKSRFAMSKEKASEYLWKQIEKEIPCFTFDYRTSVSLFLCRFIPKSILLKILRKFITTRT